MNFSKPATSTVLRVLTVTLTTAALALDTATADARDVERKGRFKGSRGGEGTWTQRVEREKGKSKRETRWSGKRGEGSSKVKRKWDKQSRQSETERELNTAGGRSAKWKSKATLNDDGTLTRQGKGTDLRGRDISRNSTASRNDDGSVQKSVTSNRGSGVTSTRESTIQRTGNRGEFTGSGTYQRSDGGSGTFEQARTRTESGWQNSTQVQNQDGKTVSRQADYQRDGDTLNRTVTVTGADGETRSRTSEVNVDKK